LSAIGSRSRIEIHSFALIHGAPLTSGPYIGTADFCRGRS
jgi:hypothetical protein